MRKSIREEEYRNEIEKCVSFTSYASEIEVAGNEAISDCVEVISIGEGHELVYYGDAEIEDITTDEYRTITTKCGTDTSVYYEDFSTGMATLSVNGNVIETYNMDELRLAHMEWEIPEADAKAIEEYVHEQSAQNMLEDTLPEELQGRYTVSCESNGTRVIRPISNTETYAVRAANIVMPAGPVTDVYPEYRTREVDSKLRYSAICGCSLDMSIKDSMYNYTQTKVDSYYYKAGTAVSVISGALKIASSTLLKSLIGFTTTVAGVIKLSSNIDYYFKESYSFSALRQAFIYDYTSNNRDVSILTEYGEGEISLTWEYINNEHTNPAYRFTGIAYPLTISYTTMYDNAQGIWERNMEDYGYWKWGDI